MGLIEKTGFMIWLFFNIADILNLPQALRTMGYLHLVHCRKIVTNVALYTLTVVQ